MSSNPDSEEDIVVPVELVHKIISGFRNGKAADIKELSEHLKYGGEAVINYASVLAERILNTCEIPNLFKHRLITPIYKSHDKPVEMPNSYRRITVAINLGQIIENIHLELSKDEFLPHQYPLQRGFTSGMSPSNGSFC